MSIAWQYQRRSAPVMERQHRIVPSVQVRMTPDGAPGRFEAVVLNYNVVDDYRTLFLPEVFNESMDARMPRIVWAHDWSEPLGRYVSYTSTSTQLTLVGEFDDMVKVPRAAQAYAQLQSGTIDQFSVGFLPTEMSIVEVPLGAKGEQVEKVDAFVKGRLDEVSLVLVGAVPDTELLSVRIGQHPGRPHIIIVSERDAVVDIDVAAGVLLDLQAGKTDIADALMKLKTAAVVTEPAKPETEGEPPEGQPEPQKEPPEEAPTQEPGPTQDAIDPEGDALAAEIEAALAIVDALK